MEQAECSICLTENITPFNKCITQCNHNYCKDCLDSWFNKGKDTCPMCRQPIQYFSQNGQDTRIISVETERVRQPADNRYVRITQGLYNALVFSNALLLTSNGLMLFLYVNEVT